MLKTFPIDFIRQALEQKLLQEHLNNVNYFGGKNQVSILSFYEQLKSQDQVDRFVETYRDLTEQQNRTGLILNGVLVSPENPTITNLYSSLIVPMTFTCSFRCMLENRDQGIATINNLIEQLKGRKVDIAQLTCVDDFGKEYCEPFMVGTIGQGNGAPMLKNGDYIGSLENATDLEERISELVSMGVSTSETSNWFYCENDGLLKVVGFEQTGENDIVDSIDDNFTLYDGRYITFDVTAIGLWELNNAKVVGNFFVNGDTSVLLENVVGKIDNVAWVGGNTTFTLTFDLGQDVTTIVSNYSSIEIDEAHIYVPVYTPQFIEDDGTYQDIIFPPEHTSFEKYKVSFSFDAIRCDEPRNLNGSEYCELSFGGSATLVSNNVKLGNDLLKVSFHKNKIVADTNINLSDSSIYYLEPLEMPSGSNANTQISQLMSNKFVANSHTDSLSLTLQYTFIASEDVLLLKQWFNYARYGTQNTNSENLNNRISPNIIYDTIEYWCSWGNYEPISSLTKIVGDISIENTESDTLTIGVSMQIQGENN